MSSRRHCRRAWALRRRRRRSRASWIVSSRSTGSRRRHSGTTRRWRCPGRDALERSAVVYDSMDYLAGFRGAPAGLLEPRGGAAPGAPTWCSAVAPACTSACAHRHRPTHLFPSSVDVAHFARARGRLPAADGSAPTVPTPRIGYAGVIDERIDLDLVRARRPRAAGLAGRHARARREDRRGGPADRPEHRVSRAKGLRRTARLPGWLVDRMDAVRAERGDPLHQSDQDARVPARPACIPSSSTEHPGRRRSPYGVVRGAGA